MPHSATMDDIKAYKDDLEKGKITPDDLPPCVRCHLNSFYFKLHAFRERVFYLIVDLIVSDFHISLPRFKCPGCGKSFTLYPDFALPYKRYTRQTIIHTSQSYVNNDSVTYEQAVMIEDSTPGYPDDSRTLAASSVHRWITSCGRFLNMIRSAQDLILQKNPLSNICRDIAEISIASRKYKTPERKFLLEQCGKLLKIENIFILILS